VIFVFHYEQRGRQLAFRTVSVTNRPLGCCTDPMTFNFVAKRCIVWAVHDNDPGACSIVFISLCTDSHIPAWRPFRVYLSPCTDVYKLLLYLGHFRTQ
jgi:hypothetical protein